MRLRNVGGSEHLPAAPGRERCPGIFMVDVFDVPRILVDVGYGLPGGGLGESILPVLRPLLGLRTRTICF